MKEHVGELEPLPVVILISGIGSNMRVIAQQAATGRLPIKVLAVISDKPDAPGLETARAMGLETRHLAPREFADRASHDAALTQLVASFGPRLVVLAGYMRLLSSGFIARFADRILNIHPSLLPKLRGLNTHRRVLEAGDCEHGVSVHFVTEELDGGPVIVQACVDVRPNDTEASLSARVQQQEHSIYPQAIDWIARGRVELNEGRVYLDGRELHSPVIVDARGH